MARLGARGVARAWHALFGEEPPCLRTLRSHFAALEALGVIAVAPGDWLPMTAEDVALGRRSRFPDTVYVLDDDAERAFWIGPGAAALRAHPQARRDPTVWREIFGRWRELATQRQETFSWASPARLPLAPRGSKNRSAGETLARALRRDGTPRGVVAALETVAPRLNAKTSWRALAAPARAVGAACLLAIAFSRGDRIRAPAGWFWRAFQYGPDDELREARERVLGSGFP